MYVNALKLQFLDFGLMLKIKDTIKINSQIFG